MKVIPVIDILDGKVVRGEGGRREDYRPLVSRLVDTCEPLDVSRALFVAFGCSELYVADLDAIMHRRPNHECYSQLADVGLTLLVDAGIRGPEEARRLGMMNGVNVVVGLETVESPEMLSEILSAAPSERVVFSLDLQHGRPKASRAWPVDVTEIVREAVHRGTGRMIVLDLGDVGMSTGGSTDGLCRWIRATFPKLEIIAGGGVRGPADLARLNNLFLDGVLVASALHDGRLTRDDLLFVGAPPHRGQVIVQCRHAR